MQRIAFAAVVGLLMGGLSSSSHAQSPPSPATQKGFSFCTVHDIAGHKVWASPVFEVEYPSGDLWTRTREMATEFHNLIGSMGGAGDKECALASTDRAAVEASRNEQRGILTARFIGLVAINKWLDVAWTPKPWTLALMAKPAVVSKHFYCYGTDTDQRATVASSVFEISMDGADPMAPYTRAQAYGEEFSRYVVAAHGLPQANPSCYFKDTHAEAEKALRDYRKMFSGFNLKFTDVAWRPTGGASAPSAAPASIAPSSATGSTPLSAPIEGPPMAAAAQAGAATAAAASVPPVAAAGSRKYCHAFIQFVGKPGGVRSKVWENSGSDGSQDAMTATLATFAVHMRQQQKTWHDFTASPIQCDMNSGFCYASALRHFGTSQLAGQFCKTTREEAETEWIRLTERDRAMEIITWPVAQ